jgi:hypothetical protein
MFWDRPSEEQATTNAKARAIDMSLRLRLSLRPSAEWWPLCGGLLDAGLKPRSTSEATPTAEADPLWG